ncbi:DegT/DnrJ/EryC1/StrS family aminotransferase [Parasediminibacterium paludis]|uniref:DegT/DnrJ/EryC1/StrS family aminotransferase n=1 Tax=Parasediminibacterium paludis TaxID=908966 RepID=A0ABV8PRJ6_9BACT
MYKILSPTINDMHIPFVDLKAQYQSIQHDIDAAIASVISETAFIGGKYVQQFEAAFAALHGVTHCISCANGTDALYIIMKMLGIGNGDEVITASNSWISSSETISQTGATPVFIDCDADYYAIDETLIEAKITTKTKAILPVHLHGQMCNMLAIKNLATKHHLFIIEDCAQAHLSAFNGQLAGTFGHAAAFSFYPGKNLGAYGDAGCILTNDAVLAEKCRMYARHGALVKHNHQMEGINSRMDGLQAAILLAKLPYLHLWTEQRIAHATYYTKVLTGIKQIILPAIREFTKHTFHLYVIRCEQRDALVNYLKENGIATAIHYPTPLPLLPAYDYLKYQEEEIPICSAFQHQILSLPIYPELTTEQIDYIANTIKAFYQV